MLELCALFLGLGFSCLVYFRSIRAAGLSWQQAAVYTFFTFIGITGTIFLSGVLIADALRKHLGH